MSGFTNARENNHHPKNDEFANGEIHQSPMLDEWQRMPLHYHS